MVLAAACGNGDGGDPGGSASGPSPSNPPQTVAAETGDPLVDPPVIASSGGTLQATLNVAATDVSIGGVDVTAQTYNGSYQPPTLRMRPGDHVEITIVNGLDEGTNLHVHGLHVSPVNPGDNVLISIAAGESYTYVYDLPADHAPGAYWYHSHEHTVSEAQVFAGLSGTIVVEGLDELLPAELAAVTHHTLGLKDVQISDRGTIPSENIDSNAATTRLVNGQVQPVIAMRPGETQIWGLANTGADIFYRLSLGGASFTVLAEDGNPVASTREEDELVLPPGKRFDVAVQAPADGGDGLALSTLGYDQGGDQYPEVLLASVDVAGAPIEPLALPTSVGTFEDLRDAEVAETRHFAFSEEDAENKFFINGKQFSHDRVDTTVALGTVEEWTIANESTEQHPFHIHVDDFQVISVNGEDYDADGWQDTVILPPGGEVVIRLAFRDFTGKFVYPCHILNHEDNGMMGVVEVVDDQAA